MTVIQLIEKFYFVCWKTKYWIKICFSFKVFLFDKKGNKTNPLNKLFVLNFTENHTIQDSSSVWVYKMERWLHSTYTKDPGLKKGRTNEVLKLQLQQGIIMYHQDFEFWAKNIQLFEDIFNWIFVLKMHFFRWKYIYLKNKFSI